jgi:hypothetical protein
MRKFNPSIQVNSARPFSQTVRFFTLLILAALLTVGLTGCGTSANETGGGEHAAMADMPAEVQAAPAAVREAYQFAVTHPEVLQGIPCYCGCGPMGHTSNYACYVSGENADGSLTYDTHALGCSICVDIAQDAMRLNKQGQSIAEIKTYIDQTYAQYGPSNMP